jgi:hypothetical protein
MIIELCTPHECVEASTCAAFSRVTQLHRSTLMNTQTSLQVIQELEALLIRHPAKRNTSTFKSTLLAKTTIHQLSNTMYGS